MSIEISIDYDNFKSPNDVLVLLNKYEFRKDNFYFSNSILSIFK